jgi:hypothetical protein
LLFADVAMTNRLPQIASMLCRVVIVTAFTALVPACSSPLTPTSLGSIAQRQTAANSASDAPLASNRRTLASYPLENGVFTITLRTSDGTSGSISGTYTGQAVVGMSGNTTASLDFHVAQTTGAGSLITGLDGGGAGAFGEGGDFTLTLRVASSSSRVLDGSKVTFKGTTQLSCSASGRIVATLRATASTPRFEEITIELQHEIGNAGCSA